MEKQSESSAIRLTNKTALALRRSARQERTVTLCAAIVLTVALAVLAVLLGIRWLPAVPIVTALAVLIDAIIYVNARSRFLLLTGQAICAEAAARQIRMERRERVRREQAQRDLSVAKEDAMDATLKALLREQEQRQAEATGQAQDGEPAQPREESAQAEEPQEPQTRPETPEDEPPTSPGGTHRRRRQAALTVLRSEDAK